MDSVYCKRNGENWRRRRQSVVAMFEDVNTKDKCLDVLVTGASHSGKNEARASGTGMFPRRWGFLTFLIPTKLLPIKTVLSNTVRVVIRHPDIGSIIYDSSRI